MLIAAALYADARAGELGLGLNLYKWHGQNGTPQSKEIEAAKSIGATTVRIPFDPEALVDATQRSDPKRLAELRKLVVAWRAAKFAVILDAHPTETFKRRIFSDVAAREAFKMTWAAIASELKEADQEGLWFEILNEPGEDQGQWWEIQRDLIWTIRNHSPGRKIVASTRYGSGIDQLLEQKPYSETGIYYTFHFYEPMIYTHQGSWWTRYRSLKDIRYPTSNEVVNQVAQGFRGDDQSRVVAQLSASGGWSRAEIAARLRQAREWADKHNATVFCGEFGTIKHAPDRTEYIRDVLLELRQLELDAVIWSYSGDFAIFDPNGRLITDLEPAFAW